MYFDVSSDVPNELHLLLKRANLESAPQAMIRRAENMFEPATNKPGIRQVLASLAFDSFAAPALAGTRGGTAATRQMLLRAEGYDIHLKIWGESSARRMAGQVLARGERSFVHSARLHLLRDGERVDSTTVDKFGEFEFAKIPEGFISLQVDLPHLTVVGALNEAA